MGSSFSSYDIARSGMYVSQRSLNTVGHNISNVNTEGYVRQQTIMSEYNPASYGKFQVGLGVDVQQTRQIRDQFLDNMYRDESKVLGYWESKNKTIEDVEAIFGDLSGEGLQQVIDQFFQGWQELTKDPDSLTVRATVRQRAIAFTDAVNHIGAQLDKLQEDLNTEIKFKIEEINDTAKQITKLNKKIIENEGTRDVANDYRDERNLLLDKLSKLANVDITERNNGMVYVSIGGVYLVNGEKTETIKADYNKDNSMFVTAKWEKSDKIVQLTSGTLFGLIEARGDVAGYKGSVENGSVIETDDVDADAASDTYKFDPASNSLIPEIRRGLNTMVSLMARKINEIHNSGVGIDGSTGVDFFTKMDDSLSFEMGNIQVNPEFNDLDLIASSATGEKGDNTIAQKIVEFRRDELYRTTNLTVGIDDFYRSIITWIGTTGQEAARVTENQNVLVSQIQNKKESISGVSMDEEVTNMMKFQHAYNASSRVMNTIDAMIDQIINRMGIVGR
ncbi:flagellar hook-associated protein FlgK [Petroclostridium sp. X23]|uniref:flagellar hook-associated protein FlgK n=1 Tax=Petroclostridium sp. X23 TaxID=3045146 RepID=UPI0024AD48F1|nr:flagellar hook-associated protein FlgK [Petroclostridium sp. X23]WHH61520.1 flagellar hook-associated protein FlgK [Petroclostridium sp. X23]